MDVHEFRKLGYQVIDWIADYMDKGYEGPVTPNCQPGDLLKQIPTSPPQEAESGSQVLADFQEMILPLTSHWNDPRYMGYFPCNHSGAGILGELLSAGLNVNAMSWATSPAATELEMVMMRWLGELLGLNWPGTIQDTASTGTLCAMLAAREQVAAINADGYYGKKPLVAYASDQAHSSAIKAARIAGIGDAFLRAVPSNEQQAMNVTALKAMIEQDEQLGNVPFFVMATVGTTSTTAIDPVAEIADICVAKGIYLHVDAALAGTAAILPEMRWLMDGVAQADSFLFNPHKWMFTNFDCSAYFCKDPMQLKRALAIQPEYLKTEHDASVENFRDWSIQLGRRFRALKLWFVMRTMGVKGLQDRIRLHLEMAKWFAQQVADHPQLSLWSQPKLNTVCVYLDGDGQTESLMKRLNETGSVFLTHTVVNSRYLMRVSFGQTHQTWTHVHQLWKLIQDQLAAD